MEIIYHRRNTIRELINTPVEYGVEIDVRSQGSRLVLHHDPFVRGEGFDKWLAHYKHQTLILNVKEEGLEGAAIDLLKKHKVSHYFFLDMSFPYIIKKSNEGLRKIAARLSEFESVETVLSIKDRVEWVWIDCFSRYPLTKKIYTQLKKTHLKLCLVSPELVRGNPDEIIQTLRYLKGNSFVMDAVCTKLPQLWKL
ncbi:MAG: hypothetical protein HQM16_17100 [Deltaproteobacteria bacterium]|nr:hypothetical protein [Deltaproteobacteria bacterium]